MRGEKGGSTYRKGGTNGEERREGKDRVRMHRRGEEGSEERRWKHI